MNTPSGVVLAFDDGRGDNYRIWKEILDPLSIPATFNITTAYNDQTQDIRYSPTSVLPMGPDKIVEIAGSSLIEIGCHGKEHVCNIQDALEGELILKEWLGLNAKMHMGYACPCSSEHVETLKCGEWKHFLYVRTGIRILNHVLFRTIVRKINRLLHIPKLYEIAFSGCVMTQSDDNVLYAASVLRDTKLDELKALVRYAVKQKGHVIFLFHSIGELDGDEGVWGYNESRFHAFCEWLLRMETENKIKMMTTAQLYSVLKR